MIILVCILKKQILSLWADKKKWRYLWEEQVTSVSIRRGAGKSLARPGRKEATATKLGIYSTYSPRNSIHFLARCSNFCKPPKKKNQKVVRPTRSLRQQYLRVGEKMATFQLFFQSREQVVVRWGQIRRIGLVMKTLEVQVGHVLLGYKCLMERGRCCARTRPPWWPSGGVFPSKCPSVAPAEMSNTRRW